MGILRFTESAGCSNELGRVAATVIRATPTDFAAHFRIVQHKREKLADRLTWLLNKDRLDLTDDRNGSRAFRRRARTSDAG
jgi:hypothetical protein